MQLNVEELVASSFANWSTLVHVGVHWCILVHIGAHWKTLLVHIGELDQGGAMGGSSYAHERTRPGLQRLASHRNCRGVTGPAKPTELVW